MGRRRREVHAGKRLWARAHDRAPRALDGGVEDWHGPTTTRCEMDSPTAVRTLNALLATGVPAQIAEAPFTVGGRTIPRARDASTARARQALDRAGRS